MLRQSKLGNMNNNDVNQKTVVIGGGINYEVTNEWAENEIFTWRKYCGGDSGWEKIRTYFRFILAMTNVLVSFHVTETSHDKAYL